MLGAPDAFLRMVSELRAAGHELDRSDVVKTMPRGYTEYADHPLAEHLRLKQLIVNRELPRLCRLKDTVAERIAGFAVSVAPLLAFGPARWSPSTRRLGQPASTAARPGRRG